MIKGVIFDADGTLLDSMEIWDQAGERYLRKQGLEAEKGLGETLFSMTMAEGAEYLKKNYGLLEDIQKIIDGICEVVASFYFNEAKAKEGVAEFLKTLSEKKIKMTVATSTDRFLIEAAFKRLRLMNYFDQIFTCSEVGAGKSEPKIFNTACEFMGTKPEETWVFEDGLYAVRTAKKAGYRTVGVYDAVSKRDQKCIREEADLYLPEFRYWKEILNLE